MSFITFVPCAVKQLYHNHYLLGVVTARSSFSPRKEVPELDGMSHGNSDNTPSDAHGAVVRVSGRLEQLNANVGKSNVNEEPQTGNLQ